MTIKWILIALSFALMFAWAGVAAPLKVDERKIAEKKPDYTVEIVYPRTGRPAIDNPVEAWAREAARDFVDLAKDAGGSPHPWNVDVTYGIARNDDAMFAVVFAHASYTGGAHGNTFTHTFNFLRPDDVEVELPELFTPRGVTRISDLAIAQLKRDLVDGDGMTDMDWIKRGAGPNARNLRSFVLTAKELVLFFDPYQVAAYAAGPQEVRLPLAKVADTLRAEPRAPAASFDCGAAKTDVEQAICSSRDLARLDRHVAEAYAEKLSWAEDDAKRKALRQEQRDWLKARDASCRAVRQPIVACLRGVYQKRLSALDGAQ